MKSRVVLVLHDHAPNDDRVVSYLQANGFNVDIRKPFAGDLLGDVTDDLAGTVIFGGLYNAYDTELHPFLKEEYRWMDAVLAADLPFLGICQGAQMLAIHLGAWAGERKGTTWEFGYYQVRPTAEAGDFLIKPLHFAQAHYHTFDLPKGATLLASSDDYENQAFRVGDKIFGLQFHAEKAPDGFRLWQKEKAHLHGLDGVQSLDEQNALMAKHDAAQGEWFDGFVSKLFGSVNSSTGGVEVRVHR